MQLRSLALAALIAAGCAGPTGAGRPAGAPSKLSFALPDMAGKAVRSADFAGRVVLVDIWATWCRPCEHSMPFYADLHTRLSPRGFTVLAVSVDEDIADVVAYLERRPLPFPVLRDPKGKLASQIDAAMETMPTSILLGPDGRVLHVHAGFTSGDEVKIEAEVEKALAMLPAPGDAPRAIE